MNLTQGLHRAQQNHPERIATVFGDRQQTFHQMAQRVARLAGALQSLGVRASDRVAMLALNSDRYAEYFQAVWWAGAVTNPVNTRWSVPEIVYSLADCDSQVLIVDDQYLPLVEQIQERTRCVHTLIYAGDRATPPGMLGYEDLIADATPVEDAMRGGDALAAILYTGGTTGFPKGVMLSHTNFWIASIARMAEMGGQPGSISLIATPLFHVGGAGRLVGQSIGGNTIVIVPSFTAEGVLDAVERHGVNDLMLVPTMLQMLLDHPAFERRKMATIKRISYGASPIALPLLERTLDLFPGVEFASAYGMTETAASVCGNPPVNHGPEARKSGLVRSVGRAGYGCEIRIVDSDGNELPRGAVGEVIIRGGCVMLGYWKKPAETAAALRDGWLHTGDGGYLDEDGYLYIVDRIKDMIVTGGENVYSAEVENILARHPAVSVCAVIGIPSRQWGESVHAVVVLQTGSQATEEELRAHCRTALAGYKCPKSVEFREAMPLSAAGKVVKAQLREPYWRGQERKVS
ncbi:long-chain-fatty-acid--CoA ligase [Noviherbaspirillum sp.]|uniref:long-chain-fatty-acid--CoA ligase n=1 Tax=Noviherbaspirillum sp. TaxID=1926288 RepID=UPI003FA56597